MSPGEKPSSRAGAVTDPRSRDRQRTESLVARRTAPAVGIRWRPVDVIAMVTSSQPRARRCRVLGRWPADLPVDIVRAGLPRRVTPVFPDGERAVALPGDGGVVAGSARSSKISRAGAHAVGSERTGSGST